MKRKWVLEVFCHVRKRPLLSEAEYTGQLISDPNETDSLFMADLENNKAIKIDGLRIDKAPYFAKDRLLVKGGTIPLIHSDTQTTYGCILANMIVLVYPFGNNFEYSHKVFGGWFEDLLIERLTDNPPKGEEYKEGVIYVRDYIKFGEACAYLDTFGPIFASSGSVKVLTVDPSVIALRDKLIEENKDKLTDKTTLAVIEEKLVAADKATFVGDPAEDFLIKSKSFNPTRKKALIMIGGSSGFGTDGKIDFIGTSLRDKWKVKDIPSHTNEARSGSFNRGKETQSGGYDVKIAYRMVMNLHVKEGFCNTTRGKPFTVTDKMKPDFLIGRFVQTTKGPVEITKEVFGSLVGKTIAVYSPQYCKSPKGSYCSICIGKRYSVSPTGLPSVVANIGDVFMYDKMGRMHGKALATVNINMNTLTY